MTQSKVHLTFVYMHNNSAILFCYYLSPLKCKQAIKILLSMSHLVGMIHQQISEDLLSVKCDSAASVNN